MYTIIDSLADIEKLDSPVVVEPHPRFHGELVFQTGSPDRFYSDYQDWVSRYCVLNELFNLDSFVTQLQEDGWDVVFSRSCTPILESYRRWLQPVDIDGFKLNPYPFQSFGLNRALERSQAPGAADRMYFCGWCCGAGKSVFAAAGAQELFNRGEVSLVIAFTLQKLKKNLCKFFIDTTELNAVVVDGNPSRRYKQYGNVIPPKSEYFDPEILKAFPESEGYQVLVLNYDKAWADLDLIKELVSRHNTVFILDECHKLLTDGKKNRSRKAFEEIVKASQKSIVWPMSATVVNHSPLRYRDVFNLAGTRANPLGTKADFEYHYAKRKQHWTIQTKRGGSFDTIFYEWDLNKLQEIRHRVSDRTQSVRKTDPAIRENFKGMQTIVVPVQMSAEDRKIYDAIVEDAAAAKEREESLAPYYRLLRYVCNNPQSLTKTDDPLGQAIAQRFACTNKHSSKLELFLEQVESLQDSDEQVVVFTQWTNLSLFLLRDELTQRKIKHVAHYGVGQSDRESQEAQDRFKSEPDCTVFLSSDAGSYGLNFQNARYVINYESPYSYDVLMQRNSRIDRADSYLDGLTAYVYVTENSVEERIWSENNARRQLASVTLGAAEVLSYGNETEPSTLDYLIFGK
jgi:superfamily II DNA or RNA helicase